MSSKRLTLKEIEEVRKYIKKLRKEGSTSDGAGAYHTPGAFTGDPEDDGTQTVDLEDEQFAYSKKASEDHPHTIKLHEVSYKAFKTDPTANEVQKVNRKILEVNKMLREISRALDHSMKLKTESSLDNSRYWKRTNEAILKISNRLSEINKKARNLANLKELAATAVKDKLVQLFAKAGLTIKPQDIDYNQLGTEWYEFDVMLDGEPYAIDYRNGELMYQAYDEEIRLGNFNQEQQLVQNITKEFKA